MAAGARVARLIEELVASFNKRSLDLPDGYFTRHTQLLLNGIAFEAMLGRSPDDPLILMLTRGVAGYRFTAKAVQHALPDATLQQGQFEETSDGEDQIVRGQCWLSGHLRGTGDAIEMLIPIEMRLRAGAILQMHATVDPAVVERLRAARLRP